MHVAILNGETWLICGGRDFEDQDMFNAAMSDIVSLYGMPSRIVHGGAKGADSLAGKWADRHALEEIVVRPQWELFGKSAGVLRNQLMLDRHHPKRVIAFPGGRGTADMVRRSREAKIDVIEIKKTNGPAKGVDGAEGRVHYGFCN